MDSYGRWTCLCCFAALKRCHYCLWVFKKVLVPSRPWKFEPVFRICTKWLLLHCSCVESEFLILLPSGFSMLPSYPFLSPPFIKPPPPQDSYNTILRLSSPPTLLFLVFSFIVLFFCYSKLLTMSKVLEAMGRAAERFPNVHRWFLAEKRDIERKWRKKILSFLKPSDNWTARKERQGIIYKI